MMHAPSECLDTESNLLATQEHFIFDKMSKICYGVLVRLMWEGHILSKRVESRFLE